MVILNHHSDSFNISDGEDDEEINEDSRNDNKVGRIQGVSDRISNNTPATKENPNSNLIVSDVSNLVAAKASTSFDTSDNAAGLQRTRHSSKAASAIEGERNKKQASEQASKQVYVFHRNIK